MLVLVSFFGHLFVMSSEGEYFKRETRAGLKTVTSRKKEGPDSKVILMSLLCCSCPSLMTASRSADEEGEYCLTKAAMRSLKRLWRMLIWPPIRSHERQCRESTGESAYTSRRLGAREQTQIYVYISFYTQSKFPLFHSLCSLSFTFLALCPLSCQCSHISYTPYA